MINNLLSLFEKQELMSVIERIARFHPNFKKQATKLNCLSWTYVGGWSHLSQTYEFTTMKRNVYRVGLAQEKYHIYKQGEFGSWEYLSPFNSSRLKFAEVLGEVLLKAEEDAKGGRFQWLA